MGGIRPAAGLRGWASPRAAVVVAGAGDRRSAAGRPGPAERERQQRLGPGLVLRRLRPGGVCGGARKPRNPLGWVILAVAGFFALSEDASFYAMASYRLRHAGLPFGWVALLAQPA